jgi:hypothetical protein
MKLVIDPKIYPDIEETLLEIKKTGLQDHIKNNLVRVIDGSWAFLIIAYWYRNQPNTRPTNNPFPTQRVEKYDQWFFYSTAQFKKESGVDDRAFPFLHFESDKGFDFLRGVCYAVVLNARVKATWDSPDDITWEKRQEIAELIENMPLSYPEYPVWADSFPIAILGDSFRFWRNDAGSVFCQINEEWALEISIEAVLHNRKPTDQEIQMIEKALP